MQPHSIYIHIPFCRHRCSYCDFNTYVGIDNLIPSYIQAICLEISYIAQISDQKIPVRTIFFGGGTPSILPVDEICKVLDQVNRNYFLLDEAEISLEANPGSLSYEYLRSLREAGVNRISLGMQSANRHELILLDRRHAYYQIAESVGHVRRAGFKNLNLDLIYGIPHQTLRDWCSSLELAISLEPDHLSLYSLTLEPGTSLNSWVSRGLLPEPDDDLSAEMYEIASELAEAKGFEQYEISNWARREKSGDLLACQHNLQYWRNHSYLGFGAGAHGYAGGKRTTNVLTPGEYIQRIRSWEKEASLNELSFPGSPAAESVTLINREEEIKETMMMGLRLTQEGISRESFQDRFGVPVDSVFEQQIQELIAAGLLEWDPKTRKTLRLTRKGRILGNQVFIRFI